MLKVFIVILFSAFILPEYIKKKNLDNEGEKRAKFTRILLFSICGIIVFCHAYVFLMQIKISIDVAKEIRGDQYDIYEHADANMFLGVINKDSSKESLQKNAGKCRELKESTDEIIAKMGNITETIKTKCKTYLIPDFSNNLKKQIQVKKNYITAYHQYNIELMELLHNYYTFHYENMDKWYIEGENSIKYHNNIDTLNMTCHKYLSYIIIYQSSMAKKNFKLGKEETPHIEMDNVPELKKALLKQINSGPGSLTKEDHQALSKLKETIKKVIANL